MTEPQAPAATTLYALLQDSFDEPGTAAVEIVDLTTKTLVRSFSLGSRTVTSLAVTRGGSVYVVDVRNREVAVYDLLGDQTGAVRLRSAPRDCVLAHGDATLYVSTADGLVAIDTATNEITATASTKADLDGVAISPDGEVVGAAGREPSEASPTASEPVVYLFDRATLTPRRVPITNPERPQGQEPTDLAFTDTGRAIVWDGFADSFYQVDVASGTQDPAGTASLERDHGSSGNTNNVVVYSPPAKRAYAQKEFSGASTSPGVLAVLDVERATAYEVGGFAAQPFVLALHPDEQKLYVSVVRRFMGGGADMLDEFDVRTESFAPRVYTFQRDDMSVRDMKIV
jgi:hypothetical protein